jgi:hypothetical protein
MIALPLSCQLHVTSIEQKFSVNERSRGHLHRLCDRVIHQPIQPLGRGDSEASRADETSRIRLNDRKQSEDALILAAIPSSIQM